jgi:hypothetical protein
VPVPALRVEIVAQAWHYSRAVPGTGTILTGPGRTWTVLFRAVPGPAHRVSAKWPSIGGRPKSGEVDLGPPVKSGRVRGHGKLHGLLAELAEALACPEDGWGGLATVAEALAAMAGGIKLAGAKGKWLAGEGECGAKWGALGKAL